jgi:hypothetical protein
VRDGEHYIMHLVVSVPHYCESQAFPGFAGSQRVRRVALKLSSHRVNLHHPQSLGG